MIVQNHSGPHKAMDASSGNDIPPLPFDTEREVLDVLARLRRELERRVNVDDDDNSAAQGLEASKTAAVRAKGKCKGKAGKATMSDADRQRVHELVVQVSERVKTNKS